MYLRCWLQKSVVFLSPIFYASNVNKKHITKILTLISWKSPVIDRQNYPVCLVNIVAYR